MHLSSRWKWLLTCALGLFAAAPTFAATLENNPKPPAGGMWLFLQFALEQGEKFGWVDIAAHVLIAAMLSLVLLWTYAAKIVGRKNMFFKTGMFVGSMVVLTAAFLALGYFVFKAQTFLLLAGLIVAYFGVVFAQTRHILDASRPAAFGLLAFYLVMLAGSIYATEFITGRMPWTEFVIKPMAEQRRLFAEWEAGHRQAGAPAAAIASASGPAAAASPDASLAARAAAAAEPEPQAAAAPTPTVPAAPPIPAPDLAALYAQLQKTRAELNTSDPAAVARFNEQAAAYHQEKAIAVALAAQKAQPGKGQTTASTEAPKARPTSAGTRAPKN